MNLYSERDKDCFQGLKNCRCNIAFDFEISEKGLSLKKETLEVGMC